MMFSKIGRSISQISRSRNVLSGGNGGRSQILTDSSSVCESRYAIRKLADNDDKFGVVLKRYLGSLAANNQRNGSVLSDINSVLANPRNRRFFHSLQKKTIKESSTERAEKLSTQQKLTLFFYIIMILLLIRARQFYLDSKRSSDKELHDLEIEVKELEEAKANGWKEHDLSNIKVSIIKSLFPSF